jgi:hypothetical protein
MSSASQNAPLHELEALLHTMASRSFLAGVVQLAKATAAEFDDAMQRSMDDERDWWPFAFLRPEPEERLTSRRTALLACLYGLPAGLFAVLLNRALGGAPPGRHLPAFLFCVCLGIFVLYRLTFAYSWNRRATRLARLSERRAAWQSGRGIDGDA